MRKRLIQSNELNKIYTKNQENRIKMEPCDENQQKINKKCQKYKKMDKHWKNLLELTIRQQQSTKIHKNKKTQTKINKDRPKSDPKFLQT